MSDLEHRVGVKEANLVVRHLKLQGVTKDNLPLMLTEIDRLFGIDAVSYDDTTETIHLAYDATHCQLEGIEALMQQRGIDISHDWWTRFKEGYYRYVDTNVCENAHHKPWNCHNPTDKH